jgi:hypothetical protein|tara:strand:- start:2321 stop:2929 length:609 start_codon:yes stop_codon:yes gene_type:complete
MSVEKSYFEKLVAINVKSKIEKKGNLDYLSWANAWAYLKLEHSDAQRNVYESPETGLNWFTDGVTGYVKVGIIVNSIEHIDYLPIKDFRQKSITVDKITSMDVNTAIQRATAKAIAMHGLGLSLYAGEDLVETTNVTATPPKAEKVKTLITLDIGDTNWVKVLKYVSSNKDLGLEKIASNLSTKYNMKAVVKKELAKAIKNG